MGLQKGRSTGKDGTFSTLFENRSDKCEEVNLLFKAFLLFLLIFLLDPPNLPPTQFSGRETHAPISPRILISQDQEQEMLLVYTNYKSWKENSWERKREENINHPHPPLLYSLHSFPPFLNFSNKIKATNPSIEIHKINYHIMTRYIINTTWFWGVALKKSPWPVMGLSTVK